MQPAEILENVEAVGGQLWVVGDMLRMRLPESSRPLVEQIRTWKPDIMDLLATRPAMPVGVRLLRWEPKQPPVQLSRYETVTDVDRFTRSTLLQVEARLHSNDWLAGNWTLSTLIDRLAAVGCHVVLDDEECAWQ
jgi:hypothetical protein